VCGGRPSSSRRSLQVSDLPARELLPGDVVEIHTGDKVPADIRVVQLKTAVLRVEQAALTGESVAVAKTTAPVAKRDCELQVRGGGEACLLLGARIGKEGRQSGAGRLLLTCAGALLLLQLSHPFCAATATANSHLFPLHTLQAKECMLFAGTGIASGACLGVVNSIGMDTEIGQIQAQIQVGGWLMFFCGGKMGGRRGARARALSVGDASVT
jgi:magnesium-transporting ATPase (P-type)